MREFTKAVKGIHTGLRRYSDQPLNADGLYEAYNIEATERGLRVWSKPTAAFSSGVLAGAGVTIGSPFPQLFQGQRHIILADADAIFEVDPSAWTLTSISTYDAYDSESAEAIISDGVWDFLDFGETYMLFNGTTWVYRSGHGNKAGQSDLTYATLTPNIVSGCKFRGRAVYAGFGGAGAFGAQWQAILHSLIKIDSGLAAKFDDIGPRHIWWTGVNAGDLLWLIYPELALTGGLDTTYDTKLPYFVQHFMRGDMGFMPMDFDGAIVRILPTDEALLVFGEDGTCVLPYIAERTEFSKFQVDVKPLQQRGACASSGRKILFIDQENELWSFDSTGMKLLGYSEYMENVTAGAMNMFYSSYDDTFYITGESNTYLHTVHGLTEAGRVVTGLVNGYTPSRAGTFEELGDGGVEDTEFLLTTHTMDAGQRSQKTIIQVVVSLISGSMDTVSVALDYRYTHSAAFVRTPFVPVNDEGAAQVPIVCLEFRVVVKSTDYQNTVLNRIEYAVQYDDFRTTYGISGDAD